MNQNLTVDSFDMVVKKIFNAPVRAVWDAWSKENIIKQWWGPKGWAAPVVQARFREDETTLVSMTSPGGEMTVFNTWTYKKIVPGKSIEFVQRFADEKGVAQSPSKMGLPPGIPDEVRHVITFRELSARTTEITVTEYGYGNPEIVEVSRGGMNECLEKMEEVLAKQQ